MKRIEKATPASQASGLASAKSLSLEAKIKALEQRIAKLDKAHDKTINRITADFGTKK